MNQGLRRPLCASLASLFLVTSAHAQLVDVTSIANTADGIARPTYVTSPPGDHNRLFITEQQTARIKIYRHDMAAVNANPFLDLGPIVNDTGFERGLLCMAFHPDYDSNGYFYVSYNDTTPDGAVVIARYEVSEENPDSAVYTSGQIMLRIPTPGINHNGGMLAFGPNDGYLYISVGDGQDPYDPGNNAQNDTTLLGKLLRLEVDGGWPYAIPPDNPFVHPDSLQRDELWAKGLRNPWRFCFDRLNGDIYIGDVGQGSREEVDFQPASSTGGENYGWRCMEGSLCTGRTGCICNDPSLTLPAYEYAHSSNPTKCSITGGFVYRGCAIPELYGYYIFGDYCGMSANGQEQIWATRIVDGDTVDFRDLTADIHPGGVGVRTISSFGQDEDGEIYICDLSSAYHVWKVVPENIVDCNDNEVADGCDIAHGTSTDENENGIPDERDCTQAVSVSDLTALSLGSDIILQWTAAGPGSESYAVHRSSESEAQFPGVEWTEIATGLPRPAMTDSMSYTDYGIVADSLMQFYIVTFECELP